jgi:ubiquinone/menaquinone biosynthesis C-methylase UbiE
MSGRPEPEYVLGTHEAELVRLGVQHRLWAESAFACWERAGIGPGQTVLDIGCGPGHAALDLAQLVGPAGRVIAIDESARFLDHLRLRAGSLGLANVETVRSDVQRLDLPEQTADAAYVRWVLCYLPDPETVIWRAAKALGPGGVLAVQEYQRYEAITLAPETEAFRRVIRAVAESWRRRGGDPDAGSRLPAMMVRQGLRIEEIRPLVRVARPGSPLWEWPTTFFRNNLPILVRSGLLTADEKTAFERDWEAHAGDPGAFFLTPPMVEIIARKPGRPVELL